MLQEIRYEEYAKEYLEQLKKGVFLSVKGARDNTMTIGWGTIGYMWKKPVLMVMIRPSRHTYELLEAAQEFTVSVPLGQELQDKLLGCGKSSGRDLDKFHEFGLKKEKALSLLETPIVGDCHLQFECKLLYRHALDVDGIDEVIQDTTYNKGDYHVLYYGEILEAYVKE